MLTSLRFLGRRTACALAFCAPALAGCERPLSPPIEAAKASATPQDHLKSVMRRLEFALQGAKAKPGSGVVSERKSDYKLIEPTEAGGDYAAEVTIRTTITVAPSLTPKPKKPPAGEANVSPVSDVVEPPAPTVATVVYKLAYKNQRWELIDPPQEELPETESICFHYALSDG